MKNNFLRVFSFSLSAAMALLLGVSVQAATNYTPVAGTSTNFNKYLIMDAGDTVPNATFSFTVAPGTAISADTSDNSVMEVMAGVGTPTIANVIFAPEDTTATSAGNNIDVARTNVQRGGSANDAVQLDSGEKFATKQATVDFSSVTFNEPGVYRYIITETANADHAAAGIIHDTDVDRVLDVYVTDNGSGTLVVSGYVMHTEAGDVAIGDDMGPADVNTEGAALDDKTDGFTNEYTTKDLKFSKTVTGNKGSRDKYFEFTVTCTNVNSDDKFAVSLANDNDANTNDGNADSTSGAAKTGGTIAANAGKTNPTVVTGAQLKAGQKFYLQHGQYIVLRGFPLNATYVLTENAEDYKSTVTSGCTNGTSASPAVISTVAGTDKVAQAGFTNNRSGIVPSGIIDMVKYGVGFALIGVLGIIFAVLTIKSHKKEHDA